MIEGEFTADEAADSAPSSVKRKRTPRVTSGQMDALLSSLEARPYLHTRKFIGLQGRKNFDACWREVAAELNQLPNGSIKTAEQWMTVWRDFKSRACSKLARLRKERLQTGNRAVTAPLTQVERRIVSLLQTPSRTPKPAPIVQQESSTQDSNLNPGSSVDEQHSAARDFLAIAESNAESMRMLAAAAKLQGEAAKTQADTAVMFVNAVDKIAEAAKTQAETSLVIAKTADKIAEALINITTKIER